MAASLKKHPLYSIDFQDWTASTHSLLQATELEKRIQPSGKILIKPNLVSTQKPPITTPVELVASIIDWIRETGSKAEIIVADGTGSTEYDTWKPFNELGYTEMAKSKGVKLLDLNEAELVRLSNPECRRFPEMYLPKICMESFLISVPVLKAHSLSGVTLSLKNLIGIAPPSHYQSGSSWKKSAFHQDIEEAIFDLNRYRKPDFTVLDATIGMQEAHLWGPTCDPPPNLLVAGEDPVAVDGFGTALLGRKWTQIGHIKKSDQILGFAEAEKQITVPA